MRMKVYKPFHANVIKRGKMIEKLFAVFVIILIVSIILTVLGVFSTSINTNSGTSSNINIPVINQILQIPINLLYNSIDIIIIIVLFSDIVLAYMNPNIGTAIVNFFILLGFGYIWFNIQFFLSKSPLILKPVASLFNSPYFTVYVLVILVISIILNVRKHESPAN